MNECAKIDQALDEMLVGLGAIVLRLASPQVTRTAKRVMRSRNRSISTRLARLARAIRAFSD